MTGLSNPSTAKGKLQRHVLAALRRHEAAGELPTSVRFLFYELEQAKIISKRVPERTDGKKGRRSDQDLHDAVMHLRKAGAIPWTWIVDETRSIHLIADEDTIEEEVLALLPHLRVNPWAGVMRPVIVTESRAMAGVFRPIADQYRVSVAATNGQAGGFLVTEVAPVLRARAVNEHFGIATTRVLYVGDLDLAGADIEANTQRVLERHTGRDLDWERVAITQDQAAVLAAEDVEPILKTDRRFNGGRPHEAWEAEALGQGRVTRMLRDRLDDLLPEPLDDVLEREQTQRAEIEERLS